MRLKLEDTPSITGDFTLGELDQYRADGYEFSLRVDSVHRDFALRLSAVPEVGDVKEVLKRIEQLGVNRVQINVDGESKKYLKVTWSPNWREQS